MAKLIDQPGVADLVAKETAKLQKEHEKALATQRKALIASAKKAHADGVAIHKGTGIDKVALSHVKGHGQAVVDALSA